MIPGIVLDSSSLVTSTSLMEVKDSDLDQRRVDRVNCLVWLSHSRESTILRIKPTVIVSWSIGSGRVDSRRKRQRSTNGQERSRRQMT